MLRGSRGCEEKDGEYIVASQKKIYNNNVLSFTNASFLSLHIHNNPAQTPNHLTTDSCAMMPNLHVELKNYEHREHLFCLEFPKLHY